MSTLQRPPPLAPLPPSILTSSSTEQPTPGPGLRFQPLVLPRRLPLSNLPTMPPQTPSRTPRPSLRTVPSLPHSGQDVPEEDDLIGDDEDEEEESDHDMPESDDDNTSTDERHTEPSSAVPDLASSSLRLRFSAADSGHGLQADYFGPPVPVITTTAASPASAPKVATMPNASLNSPSTSRPPPHPSPRPEFYRQPSRSMADLLNVQTTTTTVAAGSTLRHRKSMPSLHPPAYSGPAAGSASSLRLISRIDPRDEEGVEALPSYAPAFAPLLALMPRKMEFIAPGIQAKNRKWHKVWCLLDGTSFKVFEGEKGWKRVEGWWETKAKGKQRENPLDGMRVRGVVVDDDDDYDDCDHPESLKRRHEYTRTVAPPSSSSPSQSSSALQSNGRSSFSTSRSAVSSHPVSPVSSSNASLSRHSSHSSVSPQHSHMRVGSTTSSLSSALHSISNHRHPSRSTRSNHSRNDSAGSFMTECPPYPYAVPDLTAVQQHKLLRHYSLQNAESGVGADYIKRKNVIRVRAEGEQFLLQAPDVRSVVDWIEGFQAAANIALDLDVRPMPRGPLFPRRRRRRRTRTAGTVTPSATRDSVARPPNSQPNGTAWS